MAHFAELDSNNKVLRVVVVDNENVSADMAIDGEQWCANNIPEDPSIPYVDGSYPGVAWKQTSYNHNFRKRFAGPGGYFIDDGGDGYFTTIKQYDNWVLNTTDGAYYPPIPTPSVTTYVEDGKTFEYRIHWEQDNNRYIATKVEGTPETGYWRLNTTNGYENAEYENYPSVSADLLTQLVWDPNTSTWS